MERIGGRCLLVACASLISASCGSREISSVCLDNVPPNAHPMATRVLLEHRLPVGVEIVGNYSSPDFAVMYHDQRHEVVRRAQDSGTCFDFNPPIQLDPPGNASPDNAAKAPGLWQNVSDYWPLILLAACLVLLLGGVWSVLSDRPRPGRDTDGHSGGA